MLYKKAGITLAKKMAGQNLQDNRLMIFLRQKKMDKFWQIFME